MIPFSIDLMIMIWPYDYDWSYDYDLYDLEPLHLT